MNLKDWIFSAGVALVLSLAAIPAFASTTRVGNGDDGKDLEGAEPITAGIIFETRKEAVEALKTLNVKGVFGLGGLIPELEHSELLMAKEDVSPLKVEGKLEVSQDRHNVYARTFAEPYAPTRFFPAALGLTRAQLIALHTHEALHRTLPPNIREDEDKVALLTMAITSPYATFDRVNRVAMATMQPPQPAPPFVSGGTSVARAESFSPVEPRIRSQMSLSETTYLVNQYSLGALNVEALDFTFAPSHANTIWGHPVEPLLSIDGLFVTYATSSTAGPLGLTAKLPIWIDSNLSIGPLVIGRTKSLQTNSQLALIDREIYAIGAVVENHSDDSYFSLTASYTFPGSCDVNTYGQTVETLSFGSIWSASVRSGAKFGKLSVGGIFDMYQSAGYQSAGYLSTANDSLQGYVLPYGGQSSFQILRAGPELKWDFGRLKADLSAEWTLNNVAQSLSDLGDLAGHGAGYTSASLSLFYDL